MEIKGKVHCFFEQSGTFKNEFIKLGIPAEDYDIQNNFGETDHVMDLFKEIDEAWEGRPSVFDGITPDDLIMAFFPCIYFCELAELNATCPDTLMRARGWSNKTRRVHQLEFSRKRQRFFELALKMTANVENRGLRMVVENPWNEQNFTNHFWFNKPSFIDANRRRRGDFFQKPTAFWFVGCKPCFGFTFEPVRRELVKRIKKHGRTLPDSAKQSSKRGLCSEERSMISQAYAHNFICDNILGTTERCMSQLEFEFA